MPSYIERYLAAKTPEERQAVMKSLAADPVAVDRIKELFEMVEVSSALDQKTDEEIADMLRDHVWATMSIIDPKSEVVDNAMDRLRRAKGGPLKKE